MLLCKTESIHSTIRQVHGGEQRRRTKRSQFWPACGNILEDRPQSITDNVNLYQLSQPRYYARL